MYQPRCPNKYSRPSPQITSRMLHQEELLDTSSEKSRDKVFRLLCAHLINDTVAVLISSHCVAVV